MKGLTDYDLVGMPGTIWDLLGSVKRTASLCYRLKINIRTVYQSYKKKCYFLKGKRKGWPRFTIYVTSMKFRPKRLMQQDFDHCRI